MKISRKNILSDNISFERSFHCWIYDDTDLIDAVYERGWEHIPQHYIAELYIRLCFNPNNENIKNCLTKVLPYSLLTLLLEECKKFPYGDTRLATDLDNGNIRKVKEAIEKRWREYANADGSFPVCNETSAYLIPFILIKKNSLTSEVLDYQNKQIPEWSQAIEELKLDYSVKLLIEWDEDCHLTGHSLQLPMFLAALTKSEQLLPFDPYRFIATGAIVADKLKAVVFYNKYRELYAKFPQACFVCPKPAEDQERAIANNIGIMPEGLNLTDIRNFCLEFIVQNKLFKHAAVNREFVGRQRQLCKIHSLLNPSFQRNKKTPLLLGASGIGKTALAKHYAQMCSPYEYREYVLLDGEKKSLPDIFEMLYVNKFYREKCGFSIPDTMKSEEKFKLLIHQLEQCGKRILFILDNLSPDLQLDADIKTFFPTYSDSCIDFIATSTVHSFNVNENDVVEFIQIDGLSVSEGLELLQSKRNTDSHDEKEAAEKIVRFVGGNAWALDVIGETLKQYVTKSSDDYRKKFEELQTLSLEALTPNSNMVRITHDKGIDPVRLLQPVLSRLNPKKLEIVWVAACCDPECIYSSWLKYYCDKKLDLSERDCKDIISNLLNTHILIAGSELFSMHRLTRAVILEMYKSKCRSCGKKFAETIFPAIDSSNINEHTAFVRLGKNLQSLAEGNKTRKTDIDGIFGQEIPICWHPLIDDLSDIEKEIYLESFSVCFAKHRIFDTEQKNYLLSISKLFNIALDFSQFETCDVLIDFDDLKQILSTEKRQNAWLADAVFLLSGLPQIDHDKIITDIVQLMKKFDRKSNQISELAGKYLIIATESEPAKLWDIIKTIPNNHSWKTILDFKKISFSGLWDSLITNLQKKQMDLFLKAWKKERRLSDCIMNYEMVDPNFKVPVVDFLSQCKVTLWSMTSDMKDLIKEFDEFWNDFSQICRQANNVLYIFGEKQVEFPTFSISFDDDYSSVNRDRWFMSLKQAYEKYESFDGIISSKIEIFKRQLELYQEGKFMVSAAKLLEAEKISKELKKREKENEKDVFEFVRSGKKYNLKTSFSECANIPFDINKIESIVFFRDEWFLFAYKSGLWRSKDRQQWNKVESFITENEFYKLSVANERLFASHWNDIFFSENGSEWHRIEFKHEICDINNIFYFSGKWWISANVYHEYSYKEKGLIWDSKKSSQNGTKTVFFTAERLNDDWRKSDKLSLADGQIITPESLFVMPDQIYAIRSWDYSYHSDKHLPDSARFIYTDKDIAWHTARSSHELTFCEQPCANTNGAFIQLDQGIYCVCDKGVFILSEGPCWDKISDDSYVGSLFAVENLLMQIYYNSLYIYSEEKGRSEFNPGFKFDKMVVHDNQFVACDKKNLYLGKFIVESCDN